MQLSGRTEGVMGMISSVWVRAVVWVGEMQFEGRMGGGMGMRSEMLDSCSR